MSAREKILSAVKNNQPEFSALPIIENFVQPFTNVVEKYKTVLQSIGGNVYEVKNYDGCVKMLHEQFLDAKRIVTVIDAFSSFAELFHSGKDVHLLQDVDVTIIPTHFAVAENGSV